MNKSAEEYQLERQKNTNMETMVHKHRHTIRNIMLISIEQVIETAFKAKLSLVQRIHDTPNID
ncbi:hypothetical protein DERP_007769 [Dermatophagoides pteronyssinus]|uniref:Uncharacterized protein n=1 Tax=Dermatophagoides pteronyssinus TaxID=6956 RepID=A0ABQ8ISN8_DERPT|nr:hypothetical protein DERP_007769 [Dermatophagoides pteronyssinus]